MDKSILLPTYYIMDVWHPYEEDDTSWSWSDEINRLREAGQLYTIAGEVTRAQGFNRPVELGPDGRVWNGQEKVIAAYMKGEMTLLVTFSHIEPT